MKKWLLCLLVVLLVGFASEASAVKIFLARGDLKSSTVANLPAASSKTNKAYIVTDGNADDDCSTGTGSTLNICISDGTDWLIAGDGIGGIGDVVGPGSSTDNAIVRFDSTTGKLLKDSGCTIDASNILTCPGGFVAGRSTTPGIVFGDDDTTDDDDSANIFANCTDCGSGTEDVDMTFRQQIAGVMTTFMESDADGSFTITPPVVLNGATTLGNADDDTITINGNLIKNTLIATTTAEALLTSDDCGKTIYLNHASAGIDLFLPAISGLVGCEFAIVHMTATSDDHSINTNGGADIIVIQSVLADGNAGIADDNADIVSFVDTADTVGDSCTITNNGTKWFLRCIGAVTGAFSSGTS